MKIQFIKADRAITAAAKEVDSLSPSDGERAGVRGALLGFFVVLIGIHAVAAPTNDLTSILQKGLFEEEANHNFPAAIEAYQGVINRFDEDRKLAATAIFRLGEIYRKQGKTNEASAQYERVVREFSDQSALATLSQSYLATSTSLSANASITNLSSESVPTSDEAEEVKKIRAMIRDSPDLINAKDQSGLAPLHRAAWQGHLIVARFLVENGGDPNVRDTAGQTPLHWAALFGHKAVIELLLSHGANLQATDSDGATALYMAAKKGFRSVVEVLLAHGADVNAKTKTDSTPLHIVVANGFKSVAEVLLNNNADVNANSPETRLSPSVTFNGSPLHIAAARSDLTMAELLLDKKAKVDFVNNEGETPLALAAKNGKVEFIRLLLSHGADVNFRNPIERGYQDWTPLHYAIFDRKKEAVGLLLKNAADPNAKIGSSGKIGGGIYLSKGCTPLIMGALRDDVEILASLLDAKADPNLKDDRGLTPAVATLHIWHTPDGKHMLSLLLDHGANTETPDIEGKTLLMLAAEWKNKEVVEMLLAHKANVNARNPHGDSPLHFAINSLYQESYDVVPAILELLLSAGADVNLQNKDGKTPLNYLTSQQPNSVDPRFPYYSKVLELLRTHGAVADLPRLDAILVRRPEANFSRVIFTKGTNGWDQFTAFELIGLQYFLLSASPAGGPRPLERQFGGYFAPGTGTGLEFPDFKHIRIRHPKPDLKGWDERTVDFATAFATGDCSSDVPLQLGDQMEIPEVDHEIGLNWNGLDKPTLETLKKCLTRQVSVIVKDKTNSVSLGPDISYATNSPPGLEAIHIKKFAPLMIKPALMESKLLLTSSDLSHIKLIRSDPATGKKRELIVDCSEGKPAPSVWLRDGDLIEVHDKP